MSVYVYNKTNRKWTRMGISASEVLVVARRLLKLVITKFCITNQK